MRKVNPVIVFLTCLVLALSVPAIAQASQPAVEKGTLDEIVNLGTTVHGPPNYSAVAGRLVSQTAAYRAAKNTADISMIFPAASTGRTISTARMYILSKTNYAGTVTLRLQIYSLSGTLRHTATSSPANLLTAATGSWISLPLKATADDLYIAPGEFLTAKVTFDPPPASDGTFDARVLFEILVH